MEQIIPIHTLKVQCYQLAQQVAQEHTQFVVTKHGKPLLRISPYTLPVSGGLNALQGTALLKDDLIDPVDTACMATENAHVHS